MSTSSISVVLRQPSRTLPFRSFGASLAKLPEELILQILEYALSSPGFIAKTDFWAGECEWPECHCQGAWKHVPAKTFTQYTVAPLLAAPKPIPRLAQLAFYANNTFHLCGPQNDMTWNGSGFWLPPPGVRHWIRHLEVEIQIAIPRADPSSSSGGQRGSVFTPAIDWQFLRRLQRGVHGFTGLKTLKLMFEALYVTTQDRLYILDEQLGRAEPFCFQTQTLIVEVCSPWPIWLDDDASSGDIIRDESLGIVLRRHMSATGTWSTRGEVE
ncbi:hypothetical protein C7974DRAFT_389470 [Boeremia exigua]|uniref:uncharacterized protein n=1 Tax=Boeremia exigua TaxID=749465 RepID=UPI001E8DFC63|nr:uncharacterized protein C7974DRAFT_389470 [Boeremia exigua]KAH6637411.1 hypothetical protein C7974DRAFT_389470 [Boeremia exigua]